jgi:uncharacterized protein YkwD
MIRQRVLSAFGGAAAVAARVVGTALLLAGLTSLAGCGGGAPPPTEPTFYHSLASADAQLDAEAAQSIISLYRHNNGLEALGLDPQLMRMADEQARAMAARDKLDHGTARSFKERMKASGFDPRVSAQNVSAGYHTLDEAFSGWRDSPAHRANMLLKGATRMGIATAYSPASKYKVFWTLIVAAPDESRS